DVSPDRRRPARGPDEDVHAADAVAVRGVVGPGVDAADGARHDQAVGRTIRGNAGHPSFKTTNDRTGDGNGRRE
ncbi:MAG: hypothetical protein OXF01_19240, partial [Gemmatimonadetes bacterium]|nr:hypothetical protein [Gemmatimonadota bacterium]